MINRPAHSRCARFLTMPGSSLNLASRCAYQWGYGICDAAMRAHVVPDAGPPPAFPYPAAGV